MIISVARGTSCSGSFPSLMATPHHSAHPLPARAGIPTLLPGEAITQEALDILTAVKEGGGVISGCTDVTLATMRVVDSHASQHR